MQIYSAHTDTIVVIIQHRTNALIAPQISAHSALVRLKLTIDQDNQTHSLRTNQLSQCSDSMYLFNSTSNKSKHLNTFFLECLTSFKIVSVLLRVIFEIIGVEIVENVSTHVYFMQ